MVDVKEEVLLCLLYSNINMKENDIKIDKSDNNVVDNTIEGKIEKKFDKY